MRSTSIWMVAVAVAAVMGILFVLPTGQDIKPRKEEPVAESPRPAKGLRPASKSTRSRLLNFAEAEERDGLLYALDDAEQPYSGKVLRHLDDGLRWEINYLDGVLHGEFRSFYPNGQLQSQEFYVNGQNNGLCTMWFDNGQKSYEAELRDGQPLGIATRWNEAGEMVAQSKFTEDGQEISLLPPQDPTEEVIGEPGDPAAIDILDPALPGEETPEPEDPTPDQEAPAEGDDPDAE